MLLVLMLFCLNNSIYQIKKSNCIEYIISIKHIFSIMFMAKLIMRVYNYYYVLHYYHLFLSGMAVFQVGFPKNDHFALLEE